MQVISYQLHAMCSANLKLLARILREFCSTQSYVYTVYIIVTNIKKNIFFFFRSYKTSCVRLCSNRAFNGTGQYPQVHRIKCKHIQIKTQHSRGHHFIKLLLRSAFCHVSMPNSDQSFYLFLIISTE